MTLINHSLNLVHIHKDGVRHAVNRMEIENWRSGKGNDPLLVLMRIERRAEEAYERLPYTARERTQKHRFISQYIRNNLRG
jgi:hypothetical protein